jgi:redox-sensitive bicupin YhaK (pirin superfamily)
VRSCFDGDPSYTESGAASQDQSGAAVLTEKETTMHISRDTRNLKPTVEVRRKEDRFHTRAGWLDSRHSFSFSQHYDPSNTHHGLLLVHNDDLVKPNTGFRTHPHRDMEIVTWVLEGELEHKDSEGHQGVIYPGLAQRMSAGTGIWHSEMNPQGDREVHFIQMWVPPDQERLMPGYEQLDINGELGKGGLVPIASGRGHQAAISIRQKGAVLWGGRLGAGETVLVPDGPYAHVFVAKGSADLEGAGGLNAGDEARLTAAGARRLTAGKAQGAEILIWETDAALEP